MSESGQKPKVPMRRRPPPLRLDSPRSNRDACILAGHRHPGTPGCPRHRDHITSSADSAEAEIPAPKEVAPDVGGPLHETPQREMGKNKNRNELSKEELITTVIQYPAHTGSGTEIFAKWNATKLCQKVPDQLPQEIMLVRHYRRRSTVKSPTFASQKSVKVTPDLIIQEEGKRW